MNTTLAMPAMTISKGRLWSIMVIINLAMMQFNFIIDYLIVLPLGPEIIKSFEITPAKFGLLISIFTISAAIGEMVLSFVVDKFDRKKIFVGSLVILIAGNLMCFFSVSYEIFILGRIISGAFGGILSSMIIIYLGDIFPPEKLGRATSSVMVANGLAMIVGVPTIFLVIHSFGWKYSFLIIIALNLIVSLLSLSILPEIRKVTEIKSKEQSDSLVKFLKNPRFYWPLLFMGLLMFTGNSTIIPYISTMLSNNYQYAKNDIAFVFSLAGAASLVFNLLLGTLMDKFGKQNMFLIINFLSILPLLLLITFPFDNKVALSAVVVFFFGLTSSKNVSGITMVNSLLPAEQRGRLITIITSIQLFAGSIATYLSGLLLYVNSGVLMNFDLVCLIGICATIICIFTAFIVEE